MSQRTVSVESSIGYSDQQPSWVNPEVLDDNDEKSYSRKRSLECSSIEIQIVDTEATQHHTDYIIRVSCGMRSWIVKRRYSDFHYLDKQLKRLSPNAQFPALPPKRYLRSSSDPEIVDQRKEQLEEYLNGLVKIPQVWIQNDFVMFLNDNSNLMTFIWNFERIRRLQDMLKSAKMENESNTAQLNLDLENAKNQVKDLQDRLSHMEMIFLQQALGVASEQLPNSVIRSISYSDNNQSRDLLLALREEAANNEQEEALDDKTEGREKSEALKFGSPDVEGEPLPAESLMKALNLAQESSHPGELLNLVPQTPDEARTIAMSREFQEAIRLSNELLSAVDPASSPHIEKSKSDLDLSKLSASPNISVSAAETTLERYNPNELNQTWAAWVKTLVDYSDHVIDAIKPTYETLENRHRVFLYVRELVARTVGVQLFPIGSFVSRTFLPDADIDATAFVPKLADDSWFVKINEALCLAAFQGGKFGDDYKEVSVSNVSFVNTEIKMIRSMINGVSVDISTNQLQSLSSDALIERVDEFIGRNHLFKRSLLILKAWFHYESPRFTHGGGSLFNSRDCKVNSWVIAVLLIWTFNSKGKEIHFPLQALSHFFQIFNHFDWTSDAFTVRGPIPLNKLFDPTEYSDQNYLPQSIFDFNIPDDPRFAKHNSKNRDRSDSEAVSPVPSGEEGFEEPIAGPANNLHNTHHNEHQEKEKKEYKSGILNIIDPFDDQKNLLDGIESLGYELLVTALRDGYQTFQNLCEESSKLLGFGQFSTQKIIDEVEKLMKVFFSNTTQKYPVVNNDVLDDVNVEDSNFDSLKINSDDLHFSLYYGQIALGGKIDLKVLTQLILIILEKKGTMPVGEIGKNLQSLLGCESLSRRLKEQFSGLKRAIENSNTNRIKMGTEHPFNPVVSLTNEKDNQSGFALIPFSCLHAEYIFVPYTHHLQMQTNAIKEAQSQQGRHNRYAYRRPPPVILETHSMISQASSINSSNGDVSPGHYRRNLSYRAGKGSFPNSPGGRSYYRNNQNQIPMPAQSVFPMGMDMTGIPIPPPSGYSYPPMPVFPPPPLYGAPPQFYAAQMHNSLSSSVSSSFGCASPMSQSPMNPSYLIPPPYSDHPHPAMMGHAPSSLNRNRSES